MKSKVDHAPRGPFWVFEEGPITVRVEYKAAADPKELVRLRNEAKDTIKQIEKFIRNLNP